MDFTVTDKVLLTNIRTTLEDVFELLFRAGQVKTTAKRKYYKCSIILLGSIIEALMFHLIEHAHLRNPKLLDGENKITHNCLRELDSRSLGTAKRLCICELISSKADLKSIRRDFNTMNSFCLQKKLIDEGLYKRIDAVRVKRNEVHLQLIGAKSPRYTIKEVDKVGTTMVGMMRRLEAEIIA